MNRPRSACSLAAAAASALPPPPADGGPPRAADPEKLRATTAGVRKLGRMTAMRMGEQGLASAKAAVRLAVQGMAVALPPADAAGGDWPAAWRALWDEAAQLWEAERWEALDVLGAGPCAPL